MSSSGLQHRVMHDGASYHQQHQQHHQAHGHGHAHAHGSHAAAHPQTSMTDDHCAPCPYEDKVVKNGTTARMVLMFLRDLVEQPPAVFPQYPQTYNCPMMKCYEKFTAQFQLIQHLLTCPELPTGEFDCDKCSNWHEFPTDEKDWAHWSGWKSQHPPQGPNIQRKTSLGSKMRNTFTLRKKDPSRKQNPSDAQRFPVDTRPGTAASETPSSISDRRAEHHMAFSGHPSFGDLQKSPLACHGLPEVERGIFWPGFNSDQIRMSSAVSSIAPSSTFETIPSKATSQNTSQTTLFTPSIAAYQPATTLAHDLNNVMTPPQFIFSPQSLHNGTTSLPGQRLSLSAMSLDEPLMTINESSLSPPEPQGMDSSDSSGWWNLKQDTGTPRPTPVSSGPDACFHMQSPISGIMARDGTSELSTPTSPCTSCVIDQRHASPFYGIQQGSVIPMSRALSQDSTMALPTPFETTLSGANQLEAFSPHGHADHVHHAGSTHRAGLDSPTDELVCDECEWKPRGVRENLKGYLRKHKNTHKGARLACDAPGCNKTFSRLDNLKKHKKDKHDEGGSVLPSKRALTDDYGEHMEEEEQKRPTTAELEIRGVSGDYSMLWPALHF
ncbi:zinc finger C2H2-like protein [Podospora didyma]|uniref:Zinc finger C2H2-like protein n=1 Tax=Podospora didyma TaxID=330526 RepID=A0AAE0N780_9PEZI|nr:zinc finger C2H2-like protein [Podospora didyma]